MFFTIKKQEFNIMTDTDLVWACFAPVVPFIRAKNISMKEEIYQQLTMEQKALFMFNAYYNHAKKSLVEFYWWSLYYLAQPAAWKEIKDGLQFFKAGKLLALFKEMEAFLKKEALERIEPAYDDLEKDLDLNKIFTKFYAIFIDISYETLTTLGQCIRENPEKFVHLQD